MTAPWIPVEPLDQSTFAWVRRRAIFDCYKWDPQVGDTCAIARYPLVISREAWNDVTRLAQALAEETLAAEDEIARRPELHGALGIPFRVRRALAEAAALEPSRGVARLMRFDFHFTTNGWRISEVNSDVPGGLNEASGFPALMASHYPWADSVGDPVKAYVQALATGVAAGGHVAFVHATAYSDDQQMMMCLARAMRELGPLVHLAGPGHVSWSGNSARLRTEWSNDPLDLVVRFFPAEWLGGLGHNVSWPRWFTGSLTPLSNPATAIVTQTKRFPLVWDELRTPLKVWRALLPETRDPRHAPWRESHEWIIKPALGRVGEDIAMRDIVAPRDLKRIARSVMWWPGSWVAQQRFHPIPVTVGGTPMFPCLGVYTLDCRVIGAYGRLSSFPLIDARAVDAGVLAA
jgi:hypothetical protein